MPAPLLQLKQVNLSALVGGKLTAIPLLKDISFQVFPGDRVAIIGPSGAGKTALLRLLNKLNSPQQGSIYLENQDYQTIPVIQLRQMVSLVLQESKLLGMSVRAAIAYPLKLRRLSEKVISDRLDFWLEKLHIPSKWLEKTELELSVGQRQIVAIARALVIQPKLLLLDEPTSALDAGRGEQVIEVLTNLADQGETTILMVNHQLELAEQFCNRMLYLDNGELREDTQATQVNWVALRESLIAAEAKAAAEWD